MAISLPTYISATIGVTFTDAYLKIVSLDLDNQFGKCVNVYFNVFVNSNAAKNNLSPIGDGHINFKYDTTNTTPLMIQAYDNIIAVSEFSGGVSV